MSLLLDTHVLLWSLGQSEKLSAAFRARIEAAESVFVSVVSLWEIALKARLGKLSAEIGDIVATLSGPQSSVQLLPISPDHLVTLQTLPFVDGHNDPFDQLLIAQAISERLPFATRDAWAARYPVQIVRP